MLCTVHPQSMSILMLLRMPDGLTALPLWWHDALHHPMLHQNICLARTSTVDGSDLEIKHRFPKQLCNIEELWQQKRLLGCMNLYNLHMYSGSGNIPYLCLLSCVLEETPSLLHNASRATSTTNSANITLLLKKKTWSRTKRTRYLPKVKMSKENAMTRLWRQSNVAKLHQIQSR